MCQESVYALEGRGSKQKESLRMCWLPRSHRSSPSPRAPWLSTFSSCLPFATITPTLFCQGRWLWATRVLFRQNSLSSRRVASTAPQLFRKWELKRDLRSYASHFRRKKKKKTKARRWTDSPRLNQNWTQALVFSDPLTRRIPRGNNPSFKVCTENEAAWCHTGGFSWSSSVLTLGKMECRRPLVL